MSGHAGNPGESGVRVRSARGRELVVEVRPALPIDATSAARSETVWIELRRTQPRLFDGPVLFFDERDRADSGRLACTRGTYKSFVAAETADQRPRTLGVQAVVIGRDSRGAEHVLLGRRSGETRAYPGLWENAPSGSMVPPPPERNVLTIPDFAKALRDEGLEEVGLDLADADAQWVAVLEDDDARSVDVVLEARLRAPIDPRTSLCAMRDGRWEYIDIAWVAKSELGGWVDRHAQAVSPPTRALVGWWLRREEGIKA